MAIETKITGIAEYGQFMKLLLCGDPGSGKTLMSSTFPNPYYISAEGGTMSIARRFLPYHELKSTDEIKEILGLLRQDPKIRAGLLGAPGDAIDTIVIDTIDEVQKLFMRERVAVTKKEAFILQDYGWLAEKMEGMIRAFRNLPMNVVFTCHLKVDSDEEAGTSSYLPGLVGRTAAYLPGAVDLGFALLNRTESKVVDGKSEKRIVRYAQTFRDNKYPWVKDRSGRMPAEFPINFDDDYSRMFDVIYGNIDAEFETLQRERTEKLMIEVKETYAKKADPMKPDGDDSDFEKFQETLQAA